MNDPNAKRKFPENDARTSERVGLRALIGVPCRSDIPYPSTHYGIPILALVLWLSVSVVIFVVAIRASGSSVILDTIEFDTATTLQIWNRNCPIVFVKSPTPKASVVVRGWVGFQSLLTIPSHSANWVELEDDQTAIVLDIPTTQYFAANPNAHFMQGNSTLTVVNRAVKHNPLWLCSTEVAIPEDQRFENLVIVQEEVEDMMLVTSDVDFKVNSRFLLQAYHARVDLQSVEATKFRIALDDGSLKFSLDGNPENYDFRNRKALVVQSGSAMLTIENSIPVDLQLSKDVMSRTFVRAQHIDVEENWVSGTQAVTLIASPHEFGMNLLRQFSSSVSVNVKSHEAPLFITSRPVGADANSMVLDAWAGSEHLVAPHVNAASSQKLETVDEWVTLSAVRRPWIVRLPLLNHYFPGGVWRVLSSPAYLKQPVSFILFSLGLLVPQKQNLNVNIMGLYCRKNIPALQRAQHGHGDWIVKHRVVSSKERWSDVVLQDPLYPGRKLGPVQPFTACKQDLLDNAFLVIYEHFKAFQTKSTLNVWTETEASGGVKEVLFDLRNQAIVKEVVSLKQTWASVFAYSLNILISVTLSFKCLELLYFWFLDHFILAEVVLDNFKASSHRLAFESSHSRGDWILNVFHSREPKGINLKWSVDLDNVDSLEITLVHTNARGELERQVLFVTTPLNITQNRNGVYKLFLPYAHYGETTQLLTCLQTYVLKPYVQYRAKLRGLDETKSVLAESSWSPEIVPGYMTSFLDFPINALGSMMPNLPLSLDTFLSKLTVPNAASSHYYVICAPAVEYVTMRANVRALALDFQMGGDDTTPSSTFNVQKVVVLKTRQHITQPDGSTTYWFEKPEISFRLGRLTPTFQPIKVQIFEHDSGKVVGVGEVTQSLLRRSQTKHFREGDACCGVGLCYEPVVEMPVTNSDGKDKLSVSFKVDMALDKQFLRAIHNTNGITFVNDLAGVTLFTGTEYLLHWHTSPHCNAEWIYLHLADHESNAWICPLNGGKPVPNSGAFMWTVGVPFSGQWFRRVFLLATSQPYMPDSDEEVGVLAQSHGLQVIKSLTLSRFEFAYATFCRSANMEMEAVNINSLRKRGIAARAAVVKCCRDLRTGLAFEGHPVLYTPGQSMVSDESLLVTLKDDLLRDTSIPTTTVFKSVAEEVTILENVALLDDPYWWEMSPDIRVLRANVPLSPLMVWLDKAAPRWITLAMYSWLVDLLVFRGYMKLGSTDESTRFNQALLWDFQVRRMIVFHLFPQLVLVMELFLDIWYFFSPLVQIFCIFFMWNVVYYDTVDTPHTLPSPMCITDVIFEPTISFLLELPMPGSVVLGIIAYCAIVVNCSLLVIPFFRAKGYVGPWFSVLDLAGQAALFFQSFLMMCATFLTAAWAIFGMFVNASSMLSAGVALGAVVFVMASISRRHANAKTAVGLYIKERQQVLVSIALDRWFESRGLTFDIDRVAMEAHTGQSAHATQLAHRIRVEVASQDDRRISEYVSQLQRLNDGVKLTTLTCVNSGAPRRTILWRDNEEPFNGGMSVLWSLQRIIGPGLVFTNERAIGWEKEARRSPGTRLASIDDVESFGEEVFQLTDCADLCMLYDGVALGFDFGCCVVDVESFEALFGKGTPLTSALLVVPLFPPAESITRDTKIHMLFRHFGSCWKHSEIYSWVRKTKKPWTSNCANVFIEELNDMLDEPVSLEDGLSETDIGQFYAAYEALGRLSLDVDFEKLFPSQPADDQRWKDVRITSNQYMYEADVSDSEDENEAVEFGADLYSADTAKAAEQMTQNAVTAANLNAQKLKVVFKHTTDEYQQSDVSNILNNPAAFVASVLHSRDNMLTELVGPAATYGIEIDEPLTTRLVQILKLVHAHTHDRFIEMYTEDFKTFASHESIENEMNRFYDVHLTTLIQRKVRRLMHSKMHIGEHELGEVAKAVYWHHLNPKTSKHALSTSVAASQALQFRVSHRELVGLRFRQLRWNADYAREIVLDLTLNVLLSARVVKPWQLQRVTVNIAQSEAGRLEHHTFLAARCPSLSAIIIDSVLNVAEDVPKVRPEQIIVVITDILQTYVWQDFFMFVILLMGFDLRKNVLPGAASRSDPIHFDNLDTDAKMKQAVEASRIMKFMDDDSEASALAMDIERQNVLKIRNTLMDLTGGSGLLPADLVDEAVLLVTDSKLNFSQVVACMYCLRFVSASAGHLAGLTPTEVMRFHNCDNSTTVTNLSEAIGPAAIEPDTMAPDFDQSQVSWTPYCLDWSLLSNLATMIPNVLEMYLHHTDDFLDKGQTVAYIIKVVDWMGSASVDTVHVCPGFIVVDSFHRIAFRMGLSVSYDHSLILWSLICSCQQRAGEALNIPQKTVPGFLPTLYCVRMLLIIVMQPVDSYGNLVFSAANLESVSSFKGYLNAQMLRYFLSKSNIDVPERGVRVLWDDMSKCPMRITGFLPSDFFDHQSDDSTKEKYIRLGMDPSGMDPSKGRVISVKRLVYEVPRLLRSGVWLAAGKTVLRDLSVDFDESELDDLYQKQLSLFFEKQAEGESRGASKRTAILNRYCLLRIESLPTVIDQLCIQGLTFHLLEDLIRNMSLNLPSYVIKRMFDSLDINKDNVLDLKELLDGFELLINDYLPVLVMEEIGLTNQKLCKQLVLITGLSVLMMAFTGLATKSLIIESKGFGDSILAILGAGLLERSGSQKTKGADRDMRIRISKLFCGDDSCQTSTLGMETATGDMDEKVARTEQHMLTLRAAYEKRMAMQLEHHRRPVNLRYIVPPELLPFDDPYPCLLLKPQTKVVLDAVVYLANGLKLTFGGVSQQDAYRFTILPPLPSRTGLKLDTESGRIHGQIPQDVESTGLQTHIVLARNTHGVVKSRITLRVQAALSL